MEISFRRIRTLLFSIVLFVACAPKSYVYWNGPASPTLEPITAPAVVRGEPYAVLDAVGWVFGIPSKIILLNVNIDDHYVSSDIDVIVGEYLEKNNLRDVKVRINQYSPGDEWTRLVENDQMSGWWRYSFGVLTWLGYTILPGRIFGGDNFNPFTNTISLYSDHPAVALHELGHAKDFAGKEYKGWNAVLRILPIVPLFQEADATSDALGYLQVNECRGSEKDAYKVLYPAYGTYIGGEFAAWLPGLEWIVAAAAIPGHIVGRIQAARTEPLPGEVCKLKLLQPADRACEATPPLQSREPDS